MVSIGIPFYNAERFLENAIKSVLAQTLTNWELILVDDGSNDSSLLIAEKYASLDSRIRVISDGINRKLPYRLNQIIKEAKYEYIARMDADDLMSTKRLEKQLQFLLENPAIDLVASSAYSIDAFNNLLGKRNVSRKIMKFNEILRGSCNISHPSILVRRSWYLRNLYVEKDNILAEDYELWVSASKKDDLNYAIIDEPLLYYREVESVKLHKLLTSYTSQIKIINKYGEDILSMREKTEILIKFNLKKFIVRTLSALGMINILLKRRYNVPNSEDMLDFQENLKCIINCDR